MIVVPRGVCKNILSGRRGGSAVNIFVVLLGNVQWSFLMGTTACQGEKLPLPPHLLSWDTGSHPKDEETAPVTSVLGKSWADRRCALQRGSRGRCCLFLQATGIFPQAISLPRSQLHLRGDPGIGQALIWGTELPAGWRAACLVWVRVCNADRAPASRPPVPAVPAGAAPGTHRGPLWHPPAPCPTASPTASTPNTAQVTAHRETGKYPLQECKFTEFACYKMKTRVIAFPQLQNAG